MMDPTVIQSRLEEFHQRKVHKVLSTFSDIASTQFEGEFNVSGFHDAILSLPDGASSIWGIDRCLRIQEEPDPVHSFLFHMGIFARSLDLHGDFHEPFSDPRFHALQKEILDQFLNLLSWLELDLENVEVTFFGGLTFGGSSKGRDRLLRRHYEFPEDRVSADGLKSRVKVVPVKSLANLDINPVEGSLVGPRLEVAYRGIEIGTVVFNCFRIEHGALKPINYLAGYAVGLERIVAALNDKHFLTSIPRYQKAHEFLVGLSQAAGSSLFEKETMTVIYGIEALAHIPATLSRHQKEKTVAIQRSVIDCLALLGLGEEVLGEMISWFFRE